MRRAAGDDEDREADENPVEDEILPLADEIEQGDRDGIIGQRDNRIRHDVERDDPRIPVIAHAVGHELAGGKNALKEIHYFNIANYGEHRDEINPYHS